MKNKRHMKPLRSFAPLVYYVEGDGCRYVWVARRVRVTELCILEGPRGRAWETAGLACVRAAATCGPFDLALLYKSLRLTPTSRWCTDTYVILYRKKPQRWARRGIVLG